MVHGEQRLDQGLPVGFVLARLRLLPLPHHQSDPLLVGHGLRRSLGLGIVRLQPVEDRSRLFDERSVLGDFDCALKLLLSEVHHAL